MSISKQAPNKTHTDFDLRVKEVQQKLAENLTTDYDYILCGAGT
jgi:hypothetical protein